ncbi:MAG: lytic transglycosylase domain-containing protein, partial [Spirochaetia bacterium]|nr:lytic transglycosylase domain-containing protein [Spirochaetia bacterium]
MDLPLNQMSYVLSVLNKDELKTLLNKNIINPSFVAYDIKVVKNISNFFLRNSPKNILPFLRGNSQAIFNEHLYLANICEGLINSKDLTLAYAIQNEFLQKSEIALVYKNYSRIYDAWDDEEKKIKYIIKYLSLNPYDLIYQDKLIDYLAETNSNSVSYAPLRYWEKAMTEIPNVSIKGRLVYWYLRYLRFSNEKEKLKEILADFYTYCPGSYYATVISEEFRTELSALTHPNNYLSNRESLLKFISVKHNLDFIALLGGQNLSFAFSKNAIDLASKLSQAVEKVNSNPVLSTSVDYFKLGNDKEGMRLADLYFKVSKLSEKEKQELLVGIGDASKNIYLSLYYTRILMKLYQIPDDPILIPKDLTNRLYPRPHRSLVKKNADRFGIEEEVVYAIMRQESFFRENAISPANARGLMQVMPSTGKFLASRLNVTNYSLHDPEISIQFGAKFLSDLLKDNG